MIDEHFGINIVEFMVCFRPFMSIEFLTMNYSLQAAGLIPVVHASGGPLLDIVVPHNDEPTGAHWH